MRCKENLVSGFRACGIHPFDEMKVLRKFPSRERTNDNGTSSNTSPRVSDSVYKFLQQFKYSSGDSKTARVSRKKLYVEPGKSISAEELKKGTSSAEVNVAGPSTSTASPSAENNESESDSEDSFILDSSEDEWEPPRKKSRNVFEDFI